MRKQLLPPACRGDVTAEELITNAERHRRMLLPAHLRGNGQHRMRDLQVSVVHLLPRRSPEALPVRSSELTDTERECLRWLSLGKRPGDIALIMETSIGYIHQLAHRVMNKLGANTSAGAVAIGLRRGLIE